MTLTEFLLARIDADEARLSKLKGLTGPRYGLGNNASLMAECEAKRRIVAAHETLVGDLGDECATCIHDCPCETMLALTLPYVDHPDYRQVRGA